MENTIHKFKVTSNMVLGIPADARILHVAAQRESAYMWILLDKQAPCVERKFEAYGTGHILPDDPGEFVGSVAVHGGDFIFHVFEVK